MVLPSEDARGLVDRVMACESVWGLPEGAGTGTINCRNVSLQPAAKIKKTAVPDNSHNALKRDFIQTPPVLPDIERKNS
jgi:hypothetical protein